MFSKLFPSEEQPWNRQDAVESRIIAYSPELMLMEWHFFHANHVLPLHDHYHVQLSYIVRGSARIIFADGSEKLGRAGDAVSFAPNDAHSVIIAEPDTVIMDVFTPIRLDHLEKHRQTPNG